MYRMKFQIICSVLAFAPEFARSFPIIPVVSHKVSTRRYSSSTENVVTRLENSSVLIAIPVPGDATRAAYDKVCTELSKTIQVPGFRKGSKLPAQLLEQSMAAKGGRNALKIQAINELLSTLVEPALREK